MLFYRKKILLAVLESFGDSVENLKYQKYLFLVSNNSDKKYYSFVPYKFGCFSFESYNDKRQLINAGYLKENDSRWVLKKNTNFLSELESKDREGILTIKKKYGNLSKKNLLNTIYSSYPYYAINSEIIQQTDLSVRKRREILNNKQTKKEECLFTIGYEGRSIDEYLNLLIKNNIKTLCDVRKNPLSRKYGFSKQSLKKTIGKLGIEYVHIPELGIDSYLRKNLNTKQDYQNLFSIYKKKLLPSRKQAFQQIMTLLSKQKRVALTCFEFEPEMCHRHCISSALERANHNFKTVHL